MPAYQVIFSQPKKAKYPAVMFDVEAEDRAHALREACLLLIHRHGGIMANYKRTTVKEK